MPGSRLAAIYEPIIVGRPAFISCQTAAELRYGALRRTWGAARMRKLEARIGEAETVHSGPEPVLVYAQLRADREQGSGLCPGDPPPAVRKHRRPCPLRARNDGKPRQLATSGRQWPLAPHPV